LRTVLFLRFYETAPYNPARGTGRLRRIRNGLKLGYVQNYYGD
jgi:hypothetical protein